MSRPERIHLTRWMDGTLRAKHLPDVSEVSAKMLDVDRDGKLIDIRYDHERRILTFNLVPEPVRYGVVGEPANGKVRVVKLDAVEAVSS